MHHPSASLGDFEGSCQAKNAVAEGSKSQLIENKGVISLRSKVGKGALLDTLAQLGEVAPRAGFSGGSAKNLALEKRAKSKFFTVASLYRLIDLGSALKKSYWNTYHCCSELHQEEGKITARYCKNRWCQVCGRINTAKLIKGYLPLFDRWQNKSFVTLTVPNCVGEDLEYTIKKMYSTSDPVRQLFRDNKLPFAGVRKLEVTYNEREGTYHPHYHFILLDDDSCQYGEVLVDYWLHRWQDAKRDAQDFRSADNASCLELFKYFTKMGKGGRLYPAEALDHLYQVVRGKRTFQNFGFKLEKNEEGENTFDDLHATVQALDRYDESISWVWMQVVNDWVDQETGEMLTGWEPDQVKDKKLLELVDWLKKESAFRTS